MPEYRQTLEWPCEGGDTFDRAQTFSTTPGVYGWTIKDASPAGTPTYAIVAGGKATLAFDSQSETQILTLYTNDILIFDVDEIQTVEFILSVTAFSAVTTLVFGVASAQNNTADSVAEHAWFRMEGSASQTAVVVETDDGTTDNNDVATDQTLSSTPKRFVIDFTAGKSNIMFYIDNKRVAAGTTFSMAAFSGNLQPFLQFQKASGTTVDSVTIRKVHVIHSKEID